MPSNMPQPTVNINTPSHIPPINYNTPYNTNTQQFGPSNFPPPQQNNIPNPNIPPSPFGVSTYPNNISIPPNHNQPYPYQNPVPQNQQMLEQQQEVTVELHRRNNIVSSIDDTTKILLRKIKGYKGDSDLIVKWIRNWNKLVTMSELSEVQKVRLFASKMEDAASD